MFLSLLLATVLHGLKPPSMCQNYLVDHTRRTLEIARAFSDFLLSGNCTTSLPQRTASATRVLAACIPFLHEGSSGQVVVDVMRSRFLLYRLKSNVCTGWESLDLVLQDSFDTPYFLPSSTTDVATVVDLMLQQQVTEPLKVNMLILFSKDVLTNKFIRTPLSHTSNTTFLCRIWTRF